MNSKNKVGVIVVSYHNPAMTIRYVKNELTKLKMQYTLVVVNNDSTHDESLELAEKCGVSFVDDDINGKVTNNQSYLISILC